MNHIKTTNTVHIGNTITNNHEHTKHMANLSLHIKKEEKSQSQVHNSNYNIYIPVKTTC